MGKCVKCGKETANSYTYYSGERRSSTTQWGGKGKEVVTTYGNLQEHSGYVCTECVRNSTPIGLMIGAVVMAMCGLLLFFMLAISNKWIAAVIVGMVILLFALTLFLAARNIKVKIQADKKLSDNDTAANVIIEETKKVNPQKTYFNIVQFAMLRK